MKSHPTKREREQSQFCGLTATNSPIAGSFLRLRTIRHPNLVRTQMKKGKVAQDIAALEQPLRPLSLRVNEYTSEPELCMGVDSGAEVTVWPPELFPAEVAKCEVLRTG